jgi:hypothetical protein
MAVKPQKSKTQFLKVAPEVIITINGKEYKVVAKEFSTGSVGYNVNDKQVLKLKDNTEQEFQVGINITAIKSKQWAD